MLNTFSKDEYSELAGNIVDLLVKLKFERGFPNTIAFETIQLMSLRKDLESINNLLNSSEIIQQEQAVFHTPHIDNPDITELFLEAVKKSDITEVRRMAIYVVRRIKNIERKNYLFNELLKNEVDPGLQRLINGFK